MGSGPLEERFMPDDNMVVSRFKLCEYSGVVEAEWTCRNTNNGTRQRHREIEKLKSSTPKPITTSLYNHAKNTILLLPIVGAVLSKRTCSPVIIGLTAG